ncbi:MAG TPA: 3-methyl-2-oxobutanoate dehydrogenase subunit VorB [Clostridia bacterium]|nr:3-methyl-2-oxobutanoate dehydrogenase subunit VorB [Clostridia bacterium]
MAKELWKGNEAVAEAAIKAGCRFFFGYPITPQNEIPEYMAMKMPQIGGCFLQAESEVAAINMVYGAAGAGARVMTSSSSPGISLKQEGITYIAGAELPCVVVNMVRGGPGLGGIQPAQSDYFQSCKGGGHGDYKLVVLAPSSVQEAVDLVQEAFDIADQYRNPVLILGDGMIGQMMEPVEFREVKKRKLPEKTWATVGTKAERKPNIINSLFIEAADCERHNFHIFEKYAEIEKNEVQVETYNLEGAELVFVAYGTTARIVKNAINTLAKEGIKAGLIRPITLWPYPSKTIEEAAAQAGVKMFLSVEMSMGQMVEDVRLAVNGKKPVHFYGRTGGMFPTPKAIAEEAKKILGGEK